MGKLRLDKYLCDLGYGTRKEVKSIIKAGRAAVNGNVVSSPEMKVDNENDEVLVDGEKLCYEEHRYYILNKPSGCVSAVKDNVHPTVMKYLEGENTKDCFPVGRLDIDTEGFLLITNDGRLSHYLLSPSHHVEKVYFAKLDRKCPDEAVQGFADGIDIGDEKKTLPAELKIVENSGGLEAIVKIHEGRFHQVKRMFEHYGCSVVYLKRLKMAGIGLGNLSPGEYLKISEKELKKRIKKEN